MRARKTIVLVLLALVLIVPLAMASGQQGTGVTGKPYAGASVRAIFARPPVDGRREESSCPSSPRPRGSRSRSRSWAPTR